MKKNIYYRYNPDTDNYERIFPTFKSRMAGFARLMISSLAMASLTAFLGMVIFDAPTEKNLHKENAITQEPVQHSQPSPRQLSPYHGRYPQPR